MAVQNFLHYFIKKDQEKIEYVPRKWLLSPRSLIKGRVTSNLEEHVMDIKLKGITENYRERMQRLALFDPLFRLENKREKDENNKPIDYFGYGLLTLLFFFENMLIRNKKTSIQDLAQYLYELNQEKHALSFEGFEKVARTIVEIFAHLVESGMKSHFTIGKQENTNPFIIPY